MKILILTNQPKKHFNNVLKEMKPYLLKLGENKNVDIKRAKTNQAPRQEINSGQWGMARHWLRPFVIENGGEKYDFVIVHNSEFEVDGAWGFFHSAMGKNPLIAQAFRDARIASSDIYSEFENGLARTIIHEILHAKYFFHGLEDKTHYWQDKDNLWGAVLEILDKRPQPIRPIKKDECCEEAPKQKTLNILHHTGTDRDKTRASTIGENSRGGVSFYQYIITGNGTIHEMKDEFNDRNNGYKSIDIALTGDFTNQKPTRQQLESLQKLEKELGSFITHKEAREYGATASSCPGLLMDFYEKHKEEQKTKLDRIMEAIKRLAKAFS